MFRSSFAMLKVSVAGLLTLRRVVVRVLVPLDPREGIRRLADVASLVADQSDVGTGNLQESL